MERPPLDWNGRYELPPRAAAGNQAAEDQMGGPPSPARLEAAQRELGRLREENAALQTVVRILSRSVT